ncbi:hypothetical protein AgCh_031369 [Apium graveolens]
MLGPEVVQRTKDIVDLIRGWLIAAQDWQKRNIVEYEHLDMQPDLTYVEQPVKIMDKKEQVLRNKVIKLVRVLWQNHNVEESTWELESAMLEKYPHLISI